MGLKQKSYTVIEQTMLLCVTELVIGKNFGLEVIFHMEKTALKAHAKPSEVKHKSSSTMNINLKYSYHHLHTILKPSTCNFS